MELCCWTVAAVVFIIIAIIYWRMDADPLVLFYDKFGKSPASLAGKVAWITGASGGIGEYIAYELARGGCKLVLSARRAAELERVKKGCVAKSSLSESDILTLPLDVTDYDSHPQHVETVLKYFKKIDILINNAGRSQRAWFRDNPLAVDLEMFDLNVFGVISLTKAVLPHMEERKQGHIAVMSSVAGKMGIPFSSTYSATKHALQGWFMGLQVELAESNIGVSLICPGPVHSDVVKNAFTAEQGKSYNVIVSPTDGRMTAERCAHLTAVAIANNLLEVWMAWQPVLACCLLYQHFPVLGTRLMQKFPMKKLLHVRESGSKTPDNS